MSPRFPESLEVHGHEGVTGRVLVSGAPAVSLGAVRASEGGAAGRGACLALVLARPCLPGGAGGSGLSAPPPHPPTSNDVETYEEKIKHLLSPRSPHSLKVRNPHYIFKGLSFHK